MLQKHQSIPIISDDYPPIIFPKEDTDTLATCFRRKVHENPDYIIWETDGDTFTYRHFDNITNQVANLILARFSPDEPKPIVIIAQKNKHIGIAQWGVIKTGHFFVVIGANDPQEFLRQTMRVVEPVLVFSDAQNFALAQDLATPYAADVINLEALDPTLSITDPTIPFEAERLFCITFTSGSTGQSKGVLATHYDWLNLVANTTLMYPTTSKDTVLALATLRFGAGLVTLLGNFLRGTRLIMLNPSTVTPHEIADLIDREQVTVIFGIASQMRQMWSSLPEGRILKSLRIILSGGEASYASDFDLWKAHTHPDAVQNIRFGTSEVGFICYDIVHQSREIDTPTIPLGYSFAQKDIWLVDDDGQTVPDGQVGEIVVRGKFAKIGYWKRPDITAQVVFTDPDNPELTIYHTNDMGKILPDGRLLHMGRKNFEVKLRGYRIDLTSIESHLRQHPAMRDCVLIVNHDENDNQKLIAYYVLYPDTQASPTTLRYFLKDRLPTYMIPHYFVQLDTLPKTEMGKLKRPDLPPITAQQIAENTAYTDDPSFALAYTPTQYLLTEIWQELLKLEPVSIHAKWLDLGGDSLLAMMMILHAGEALQREIPTNYINQAETIAELAALIDGVTSHADSTIVMRDNGTQGIIFFPYNVHGNLITYQPLLRHLTAPYQFVGILPPHDVYTDSPAAQTIPEVAAYCIQEMRKRQPDGVYHLAGYSFAAKVTYEIARQLHAQGLQVGNVIILDTYFGKKHYTLPESLARRWFIQTNMLRELPPTQWFSYLVKLTQRSLNSESTLNEQESIYPEPINKQLPAHFLQLERRHAKAVRAYAVQAYHGDLIVVQSYLSRPTFYRTQWYWKQHVTGNIRYIPINTSHFDILKEPHVKEIAAQLDAMLR